MVNMITGLVYIKDKRDSCTNRPVSHRFAVVLPPKNLDSESVRRESIREPSNVHIKVYYNND